MKIDCSSWQQPLPTAFGLFAKPIPLETNNRCPDTGQGRREEADGRVPHTVGRGVGQTIMKEVQEARACLLKCGSSDKLEFRMKATTIAKTAGSSMMTVCPTGTVAKSDMSQSFNLASSMSTVPSLGPACMHWKEYTNGSMQIRHCGASPETKGRARKQPDMARNDRYNHMRTHFGRDIDFAKHREETLREEINCQSRTKPRGLTHLGKRVHLVGHEASWQSSTRG